MDIVTIKAAVEKFLKTDKSNYVRAEDAERPELAGLRLFDSPAFAVGGAGDPLFERLRGEDVVHPGYMLPEEWLPGAKSVISFCLPIMQDIKDSNTVNLGWPSPEWMHARVEGQEAVAETDKLICALLREAGYEAVAPSLDGRWDMLEPMKPNWSERHTGFVCGLGTFGLSKGLITEKGVAVRLGSVVTTCPLEITKRKYEGVYDYCVMCGKCQRNCPVGAIDITRGPDKAKDHEICRGFLRKVRKAPPKCSSGKLHFGCGKCQVAVPCESRIPEK